MRSILLIDWYLVSLLPLPGLDLRGRDDKLGVFVPVFWLSFVSKLFILPYYSRIGSNYRLFVRKSEIFTKIFLSDTPEHFSRPATSTGYVVFAVGGISIFTAKSFYRNHLLSTCSISIYSIFIHPPCYIMLLFHITSFQIVSNDRPVMPNQCRILQPVVARFWLF